MNKLNFTLIYCKCYKKYYSRPCHDLNNVSDLWAHVLNLFIMWHTNYKVFKKKNFCGFLKIVWYWLKIVLYWLKSSFGFFCKMLKTGMNFLVNPILWWEDLPFWKYWEMQFVLWNVQWGGMLWEKKGNILPVRRMYGYVYTLAQTGVSFERFQ